MKLATLLAILALLAPASCSAKPKPLASGTGAATEPEGSPGRAPVVVRVSGPEHVASGDVVDIRVVVERRHGDAPITLMVTPPPGTTMVQGQAVEILSGTESRAERTFKVECKDKVPVQDLLVTAHGSGPGWGVHATGAYRFGRPEPQLARSPRSGAPIVVHGRNLGRGIPLGATPDGGPAGSR